MSAATDNMYNAAAYAIGNCTRFVAGVTSWIPANLGDAKDWLTNAKNKGLPTSATPQVGAVAVWNAGPHTSQFGHVAKVIAVSGNSFTVQEENYQGLGVVDTRVVTSPDSLAGFILPPGGLAGLVNGFNSLNLPGQQAVDSAVSSGAAIGNLADMLNPAKMFDRIAQGFGHGVTGAQDFAVRFGLITIGMVLLFVGIIVLTRQEGNVTQAGVTAAKVGAMA